MRIAIVENEIVVNVIVGEVIPKNGIECDDVVSLGWTCVKGKFIAPPAVADSKEEIL